MNICKYGFYPSKVQLKPFYQSFFQLRLCYFFMSFKHFDSLSFFILSLIIICLLYIGPCVYVCESATMHRYIWYFPVQLFRFHIFWICSSSFSIKIKIALFLLVAMANGISNWFFPASLIQSTIHLLFSNWCSIPWANSD